MKQLQLEQTANDRPWPVRSTLGTELVAIVPLLVVGLLLVPGCSKAPGGAPGAQAAAGGQQAPANPDEALPPGPPPGKGGAPDVEPRGAGRGKAEHPDELKLPPAKGNTFWASAKPGPEGDGTREQPFRDLQAALRRLRPGDRITLLPGDFRASFVIDERCAEGTAEAPIEVVGRVNAIVRGGADSPTIAVKRSGWNLLGLDIVPGNHTGPAVEIAGARDVLLFRCHLHGGDGDGLVIGPGSERITLAQIHIHGFGRVGGPPQRRAEVAGLKIAPGTRGITVKGSKIQNVNGPPVKVLTPAEYGPGPNRKLLPPAAELDLGALETVTNWPETNPT